MASDEEIGCGTVIICMVFTCFLTAGLVGQCTHDSTRQKCQDEAVTAGRAEYYLDANNERQWRWKGAK